MIAEQIDGAYPENCRGYHDEEAFSLVEKIRLPDGRTMYGVSCTGCMAKGPLSLKRSSAISMWNVPEFRINEDREKEGSPLPGCSNEKLTPGDIFTIEGKSGQFTLGDSRNASGNEKWRS